MAVIIPQLSESDLRGGALTSQDVNIVFGVFVSFVLTLLFLFFGFYPYSRLISTYSEYPAALDHVSPKLLAQARELKLDSIEIRPLGFATMGTEPTGYVNGQKVTFPVYAPAYKEALFHLDLQSETLKILVYHVPTTVHAAEALHASIYITLSRSVKALEQHQRDLVFQQTGRY